MNIVCNYECTIYFLTFLMFSEEQIKDVQVENGNPQFYEI
jgi:hypothetical protein